MVSREGGSHGCAMGVLGHSGRSAVHRDRFCRWFPPAGKSRTFLFGNDFPATRAGPAVGGSDFRWDIRQRWKSPALCGVEPGVNRGVIVREGSAADGDRLEVGSNASLL